VTFDIKFAFVDLQDDGKCYFETAHNSEFLIPYDLPPKKYEPSGIK
jgi:hypothetical protein